MSLSVQFLSLLAMIGTGIVAGAFMDMISSGIANSSKKSIIRRYKVWIDVVGWILVGAGSFYILFLVRDGAWRIYDPFAQICGMLLYIAIFYKPFRLFGRILLAIIVRPILFIGYLIVSIIRQIIRLVIKIVSFFLTPFVKLFHILSRKLFIK